MTTLTESKRNTGFLVSEGPGQISRDEVTIGPSQDLSAGAVLGSRQTLDGLQYVELDPDASDGSESAKAILLHSTKTDSVSPAKASVISRIAEVNGGLLSWKTGITQAQVDAAVAQLATKDIIVR